MRMTDRISHRSPKWLRASRAVAVVTALAVAAMHLPAAPARAQEKDPAAGLPIIRDAEIEQPPRDYTQPVLKVAGLGQRNIRVVLINDRSFNAFVIDAKRIFVNTGALMDAETPNQIIGVLAHETGHISGGHLSKLRAELANAQTAAIWRCCSAWAPGCGHRGKPRRGRRQSDGRSPGAAERDHAFDDGLSAHSRKSRRTVPG